MVSSAKQFTGLTTPSAALRWLRDFLLVPPPPLLCEEGNAYATQLPTSPLLKMPTAHFQALHSLSSPK